MCVCPALNAYCGQHRKPRSTIGYAKKLAFQVGISCNPGKKNYWTNFDAVSFIVLGFRSN